MKPVCNKVSVKVPATSANLGSGFDTAGIALEYFDSLMFALDESQDVSVIIHGEGEDTLPKDETHLVVSTFRKACKIFGLPNLRFTLEARNQIPQARGMGSSASAIVAGVAAAWTFAHEGELNREEIFEIAASIEGHPDNVAPAVFGGLTMSWKDSYSQEFHTVRYKVSKDISVSVFVPNFELSTELARRALPANVPYGDAIFNVSRAAMIPVAFGALNGESCDAVKSNLSRNELLFKQLRMRFISRIAQVLCRIRGIWWRRCARLVLRLRFRERVLALLYSMPGIVRSRTRKSTKLQSRGFRVTDGAFCTCRLTLRA